MKQPKGDKACVELLLAGHQHGLEPLEVACALGLPDKTRPEEDHASCQLSPPQEPFGRPIQPATNPTKLSKEVMTPFHRLANLANPRLPLAPRRGLQAKARGLGTLPGRSIAVGAIGLGRGQTPDLGFRQGDSRRRRWHDQRGE
jgi:hypothetical protein